MLLQLLLGTQTSWLTIFKVTKDDLTVDINILTLESDIEANVPLPIDEGNNWRLDSDT